MQQSIEAGGGAQTILDDGLPAGMNIIGARFKLDEAFVPDVLIAARAMSTGVALRLRRLGEACSHFEQSSPPKRNSML